MFSKFIRVFLAGFVSVILLANPQVSLAGVKVNTKTSFYKVKGLNGKVLNENMIAEGRKRIPISHAIAATRYDFDYVEPKIVVKDKKCIVEEVQVILNIEYIYPKWVDRNRASKALRGNWDRFYQELKIHEEHHGKIALKGAKALEREFLKTNGNTFWACRDMGRFATFRFNNAIRKTRSEQKAFDRKEYSRSSKISKLQRKLYETE